MTKQEVQEELFKRFLVWMRGQTVVLNADGTHNYYSHDVNRFLSSLDMLVDRLHVLD